ncbi:MAG: GNAT family N-acetyltransferase [Clostridia bacterium]|nr:GNAT family N-acetyltransferase [Clostridia bacterium]
MNAEIDVSNVRLETERIVLRPFALSDLDDLFAYACVDGVGQAAGWSPHKTKEESLAVLQMFLREKKVFAIVHKRDGKVIGSLGIEELSDPVMLAYPEKGRELGYVLSKDYWGQGLMPESVKAVISYLFETLRLDFVSCAHFLSNDRSRRVIEKCGFTFERIIEYHTNIGATEQTKSYLPRNPDAHA